VGASCGGSYRSEGVRRKSRIERQRMIKRTLAAELDAQSHALAIQGAGPGEGGGGLRRVARWAKRRRANARTTVCPHSNRVRNSDGGHVQGLLGPPYNLKRRPCLGFLNSCQPRPRLARQRHAAQGG